MKHAPGSLSGCFLDAFVMAKNVFADSRHGGQKYALNLLKGFPKADGSLSVGFGLTYSVSVS